MFITSISLNDHRQYVLYSEKNHTFTQFKMSLNSDSNRLRTINSYKSPTRTSLPQSTRCTVVRLWENSCSRAQNTNFFFACDAANICSMAEINNCKHLTMTCRYIYSFLTFQFFVSRETSTTPMSCSDNIVWEIGKSDIYLDNH